MSIRRESAKCLSSKLLGLLPLQRRCLLVIADALLLPLSLWFSFWLRLAHPFHPNFTAAASWLIPAVCLIGLPVYAITGQYQGLTRYVGSRSLYQLVLRNGLLVLLLVACGEFLRLPMPPRSSWLLLWLLLTGFTGAVRFGLRDVLLTLQAKPRRLLARVAIYGAGSAGVELAATLALPIATTLHYFLMMIRPFGDVRLTAFRLPHPKRLSNTLMELIRFYSQSPRLAVVVVAKL